MKITGYGKWSLLMLTDSDGKIFYLWSAGFDVPKIPDGSCLITAIQLFNGRTILL